MIRVAHLTFSGAFGGREKVVFTLAESMLEQACPFVYLVLEDRVGEIKCSELLNSSKQYNITLRLRHTGTVFSYNTLRELGSLVREDKIDVIHAHCHKSMLYACLLKWLYVDNVINVFTLHGLILANDYKYLLHKGLNALGLMFADGIIGCSEQIVDSLKNNSIFARKVTVIRNAINPNKPIATDIDEMRDEIRCRFNIPIHKTCWVGTAGRLAEEKNIPLFLNAAKSTLEQLGRDDIVFLLAGDGEMKDEILMQAEQLGLGDSFCYIGFHQEMDSYYHSLDLFVLTSNRENTPMALLEAMSCRLPVVASDVGGVPDVVIDGVTGLLFPCADQVACTNKITTILSDKELAKNMGLNSQKRIVEKFNINQWVNDHISFYKDIIDKSRAYN